MITKNEMTPERIAAIRARCAAALDTTGNHEDEISGPFLREADIEFASHARVDLPCVLDELLWSRAECGSEKRRAEGLFNTNSTLHKLTAERDNTIADLRKICEGHEKTIADISAEASYSSQFYNRKAADAIVLRNSDREAQDAALREKDTEIQTEIRNAKFEADRANGAIEQCAIERRHRDQMTASCLEKDAEIERLKGKRELAESALFNQVEQFTKCREQLSEAVATIAERDAEIERLRKRVALLVLVYTDACCAANLDPAEANASGGMALLSEIQEGVVAREQLAEVHRKTESGVFIRSDDAANFRRALMRLIEISGEGWIPDRADLIVLESLASLLAGPSHNLHPDSVEDEKELGDVMIAHRFFEEFLGGTWCGRNFMSKVSATKKLIAIMRTDLQVAREALEELSLLGGGGIPGNSDGNRIAQRALATINRNKNNIDQVIG